MGNKLCGLNKPKQDKQKQKSEKDISTATFDETDQIPAAQIGKPQNGVHPDPVPSKSVPATDLPTYKVWYRHTGQDFPSNNVFPARSFSQSRGMSEILEDIGEHNITHLSISTRFLPSLNDIAPKLTHLHISCMKDPSNLESLAGLNELTELHLWNGDFSNGLPSVVGELKSLTQLHIYGCKLQDLPENLGRLKKLQVLHLRNNNFSNGLPIVIGELTSLTELHMESCQITSLPENICQLKQLKVLELSGNKLSGDLTKIFKELVNLTRLYLQRCSLTELPHSLGELKKLRVLNLQVNDFSSGLPSVVGELTSLMRLNIGNCGLTHLPAKLGKLQQLEVLHLEKNDFSNGLSEVIGELGSLNKLYLQKCSLTELPQSMSELKELKLLYLDGNRFFSGCPDVVTQLTSLTELLLKHCALTSLPPRFGKLHQLEVLHLEENNFSNGLPEVFAELVSLTELHLQNCCLTNLPSSFGELQRLEVLELQDNNFSNGLPEVVADLTSLTELHLEKCSLTDLPPRMTQLTKLRSLVLHGNDFKDGLPNVITELTSLNELRLGSCSLSQLPESLNNLQQLHELDLRKNRFKEVSSVVYELKDLKRLNFDSNIELVEMDDRILKLENLQRVSLRNTSLQTPPPEVACQGLRVIKKYFTDLAQKAAVSTIPVAIVGEAFAGKTCIAKSLISQKRKTLERSSPLENATEIFEVETLKLETSEVNLIDYGGQDIYHVAYQLALKEKCVPLIVVNMARYKTLIEEINSEEEATKRLCMQWLCHLYVAQPTLGRPMLALTHIDELSSREEFEELKGVLLQRADDIRMKWLTGEVQCSETDQKGSNNIERVSYIEKLKFNAEDIFEFTDKNESSDVKALTERIKSRCEDKIPQNWKDVGDFLKQLEKPYIEVSDLATMFPDCRDILRYLHNTGAILWFDQKERLAKYVFHRTQSITNMVALLFPLDKNKMKTEFLRRFSRFSYKKQPIGQAAYQQFLDNYLYETAGMIDEAFLHNLVETQSPFNFTIASELLKSFHIAHGPIGLKDDLSPRTVYLIPSFTEKPIDISSEATGRLQLRLDLIFDGLPLPKHVYQLMTVRVLNLKLKDESVEAASNGGMVQHDENCTTFLVHDYDEQKVIVQVSTNVACLKDSWDRLKKTTEVLKSLLQEEWPACLVELKTYCTHCLFLRDPAPGSAPNPAWYTTNETFPGLKLFKCLKSSTKIPAVPRPLLFPCSNLDSKEIAELEGYLTKWQSDAFDTDRKQEVS